MVFKFFEQTCGKIYFVQTQNMWGTNASKRLILFLGVRPDNVAEYDEISLNFSNPDEVNKCISDSIQKSWIVKSGGTSYRLTNTGTTAINSMDKDLKIKLLQNLKTIVTMKCPTCSAKLSGIFHVNTKKTQIICHSCNWKSW